MLRTKIINIAYLVLQGLQAVAFIAKKEYFSAFGTVLVFILYLLFLFYEHKRGIAITSFIRISVIITLLASSFLGEYLGLYYTSVFFDNILHTFGTFSISVFIFSLAEKRGYFLSLGKTFLLIYMLLLGSFLGTMFEIGEFICDIFFKMSNQHGLIDTNLDIIFNILGAVLSGIFIIFNKHLPK